MKYRKCNRSDAWRSMFVFDFFIIRLLTPAIRVSRYQNTASSSAPLSPGWTARQGGGRWRRSCRPSEATTAWPYWAASSLLLEVVHRGTTAETPRVTYCTDTTLATTCGPGYRTRTSSLLYFTLNQSHSRHPLLTSSLSSSISNEDQAP